MGLTRTRLALLPATVVLTGCCLFPSPGDDDSDESTATAAADPAPQPAASSINIKSVIFARELDDEWQPVGGPVTEFRADEHTVWARVLIDGRPRSGTLTMRWLWRDDEIATTDIDLSDINGGLLFSAGQDTAIRGFMTTPRLYIGEGNRLVLLNGETELGSYGIRVVPPEGARPSRFVSGALYANYSPTEGPSNPTSTFGPNDTVHVAGTCALGHLSWFDLTIEINGEQNDALTQEGLGPEGGGDEGTYAFQALPEGGWPPGQHRARLVLDDTEVAAYDFTVAEPE